MTVYDVKLWICWIHYMYINAAFDWQVVAIILVMYVSLDVEMWNKK